MGTFAGHVLPGFLFIIIGIWHIVQFTRTYFKRGTNGKFVSNTYFDNVSCLNNKLPCESLLKVVATTIHFIIELITGFRDNDGFVNWGNTQHMALVTLFCFQGVVEILVHNRINVPRNLQYIAGIVAFAFESFIFSQHLHGREMVDTKMHITIVILAAICAILFALEMQNRNSITMALAARFVLILQGVWLVEIGFIIFPPSNFKTTWSLMDHNYLEWISATLGFEAAFILLFILLTWLFFAMVNGRVFEAKEAHEKTFNDDTYHLLDQEEQNNNEL